MRFIKTRRLWECKNKHAKKQFSIKLGTIFEDSAITQDKWLFAMWMVANCKNGISSYELARTVGVTQKSAWFMLHRIRLAMQDDDGGKVGGQVEVDETFIGGKARNMHRSRVRKNNIHQGGSGKAVVVGMLQRGGKVKTAVVPDRKRPVIHGLVREHVESGSELITDEMVSYIGLAPEYVHQIVNHLETYVKGHVHTNGIENFWSLLKRGLNGTYVSVEPFHLFRYVDEQAFRFNNRKDKSDFDRFSILSTQVAGRRITYAKLTNNPDTTWVN